MRTKILYIIFIFSLFPFVSFSQTAQKEELSLANAIQVGLKQNFDILLGEKDVETKRIQNSWGEAGLYPSVDLKLTQANSISDQSHNPTSFIQTLLWSNSLQGNASLNWVLFNGFKVKANKRRLEELQYQSEGSAALVIENTLQGIILAYYNAKLQREKMALLKNVLELSRDKWDYQKAKNELGVSGSIDLLQFENSYLSDSSNLVLQELAYKNAIRNLNILLGIEIEREWVLTDKLMPDYAVYDYQTLKEKMQRNNLTLQNEMLNIKLLEQDINIAKTSLYPVLSFNSGANYAANSFKIGDFNRVNGATINYLANFTLSIRVFDGGKVKRALQMVKVQEDITNLNIEKAKAQVSQELANYYDLYNTRMKIFEISKRAFVVAEENFKKTKVRNEGGIINSFTVRDIEMAYLQAGLNLFDAMYTLQEAKINLIRLTGGILDEANVQK